MDKVIVSLVIFFMYHAGALTVQIIVATDNGIFLTDIKSNQTTLLSGKDSQVHSLDYHYKKSYLFFVSNNQLKRLHLNITKDEGPRIMSLKNITKDELVQSIAVDWVQERLYWTKSNHHGVKIMESNLSGKYSKHIITSEDLEKNQRLKYAKYLENIVVDPDKGLLFAIVTMKDGYSGYMVKINLQRLSDLAVINAGSHNAKSMALDIHKRRLIVVNKSGNMVYSCDYNGQNIEMRVGPTLRISTMSVSENYLYFVTHQNLLHQLHMSKSMAESIEDKTMIPTNFSHIYTVKVFDHRNQLTEYKYDQELCRRKHCSFGCHINSNQEVFCTCADGSDLAEDGVSCKDTEWDDHLAYQSTTIGPKNFMSFNEVSISKNARSNYVNGSSKIIGQNSKAREYTPDRSQSIVLIVCICILLFICTISAVSFFMLKVYTKRNPVRANNNRVLMTHFHGDEERLIMHI